MLYHFLHQGCFGEHTTTSMKPELTTLTSTATPSTIVTQEEVSQHPNRDLASPGSLSTSTDQSKSAPMVMHIHVLTVLCLEILALFVSSW